MTAGVGEFARHRIRIERRAAVTDGYGNTLSAWSAAESGGVVHAAVRPQYGREALEAGRVEATMRATVTVHDTPITRALTAADRVVFVAGPYLGQAFSIQSTPVPSPDGREISFNIESGVA
jgi:head-tail adaptor